MGGRAREAVLKRRKELGLSQQEVADRAGVSRSLIAHIECGTKCPSLFTAFRIAKALETDVESLFGREITDAENAV